MPAAATTSAPWPSAAVTASHSVDENAVVVRLRSITRAPCAAAHAIPLATAATVPDSSACSTFTGMSGEENATPAMPVALSASAPAMPATCVPWPIGSLSSARPWTQTSNTLMHTAASAVSTPEARSSCVESIPVSTMAIFGVAAGAYEPGKMLQPSTAWICWSPHCEPYLGSSGTPSPAAWTSAFGSA